MGIKKLFTFLENNNLYKKYSYLNDLVTELGINKSKLLVGVDGNLFCYKYTHSYDNMLIGFFNQILKFLSNKIIPIYIFDGGTLQEKENTILIRNHKKILSKYKLVKIEEQIQCINDDILNENNIIDKEELLLIKKKLEKKSIKINNNNIIILLELFDLLNIPYLFSHGEGEYLAVMLNKYFIIDFFLTDDTDPIPAGIHRTIKFYNNAVYYLETKQIYKSLNLNKNEFCDFCILLGTDYAVFNHGYKPNELYELILKHKTIEEIVSKNIIECINNESLVLINKIRNIYFYSEDFEKDMFLKKKYMFDDDIDNKSNVNINDELLIKSSVNMLIDYNDLSFYSNIILEFWDEYIDVISENLNEINQDIIIKKSIALKSNICKHVCKSKFNIKNIIKFIKNNIGDITTNEIDNIITSFQFLNNFGI